MYSLSGGFALQDLPGLGPCTQLGDFCSPDTSAYPVPKPWLRNCCNALDWFTTTPTAEPGYAKGIGERSVESTEREPLIGVWGKSPNGVRGLRPER